MDLLVSKTEEMSVTEISKALKIPKGTVHRIPASLVKYKYARQDQESKKYGSGIYLPGNALLSQLWNSITAMGGSEWDHSSIVKCIEVLSNTEVVPGSPLPEQGVKREILMASDGQQKSRMGPAMSHGGFAGGDAMRMRQGRDPTLGRALSISSARRQT